MSHSPFSVDTGWFKQLFESSPDPTWIIDGNRFVECNEAAVRTLGYTSHEEFLNVHPSKLSPPVQPDGEDSYVKAERMMAIAKDQGLHRFEWMHTRADGMNFDAEVTLSAIALQDRQVIYCVWRDITERKHAQDTRARLAAIVENSDDAIFSRTLDGTILSWNAGAEKMLGYSAEEVIGKSVTITLPPGRPPNLVQNNERLLRGEVIARESDRMTKDGRVLSVLTSHSAIRDQAGNIVGASIILQDITALKQAETTLRESEARYRSVIAAIVEGVVLRDQNGRIVTCNASAERILGRTLDQMRGAVYFDPGWVAIRENGSPIPDAERAINVALRSGQLQSGVVQGLRKPDGAVLWLSMNVQPLFDESGTTLTGVVSTLTDITERKHAELRQTLEHAVTRILAEAVTLADAAPRIIQTLCETMGWHCGTRWQMDTEAGVLRCVECWAVDTPEIREFMAGNSMRSMNPHEPSGQGLARRIYNSGRPLWVADISQDAGLLRTPLMAKAGLYGSFGFPLLLGGEVLGLMEFFHRDVRAPDAWLLRVVDSIGNQIGQFVARKNAEERLHRIAKYDELTGLPNRSMFRDRLDHSIIQAQRHARPLAVLFIDLDRFKNINDTLGHEAGDCVLKEVAERLRGCLRDGDTVGRLGGDEFVVLIEEFPQPEHVAAVAQRILVAAAHPFVFGAQQLHVSASIGISTYPADGENMESLLKNADIAMYRAKEQGRNNYQYYSAQMNIHTIERLELESDLRRALEHHEFLLYYQPKIDIVSGRITGMEALLRWQHAVKGLVPPMQFIPLAEETGLIGPIGAWVLKNACAQNQSWQEQGLPPLRVAVNLSARQFTDPALLQTVAEALKGSAMNPALLELEITESMVMHDPERAVKLLHELRAMGVYLAIDDFGTGYSSLSYLKRFPINTLKVDRSFIRGLPGDADDAAITRAILAMARSLKLNVIAEGVETIEQLRFLREHECDEMQGYVFSRPVPAHEFVRLVLNNTACALPNNFPPASDEGSLHGALS